MKLKKILSLGLLIAAFQSIAQPINDDCVNAIELIPDSVVSMSWHSYDGATKDVTTNINTPPPYEDVFFKFTATDYLHNVIVDAMGSSNPMNIGMMILEGDCQNGFSSLASANMTAIDYSDKSACRYDGFNPGQEYYIYLSNVSGSNMGDFEIMVTRLAEDGEWCYTSELVNENVTISGSNYFSSADGEYVEIMPEDVCAVTLENGYWYEFIASATGNYNILFENMDYIGGPGSNVARGHQIGVFATVGGDCMDMVSLACDSSEYYYADLNVYMVQGEVYRIVVEGDAGCLVSYDMVINSPNASLQSVLNDAIKLYPTKINETIHFDLIESKDLNIEVIASNGKVMYSEFSNGKEKLEIRAGHYDPGVYFVHVNGDGVNKTLKFIK